MDTRKCLPKQDNDDGDPPIHAEKVSIAEDVSPSLPMESGNTKEVQGGLAKSRKRKLDYDEANVDGEDDITPKASPHNEEKKGDESVAESISTTHASNGVSPAKAKKEIVSSLQPWTEKYTPKIPEDVIGNKKMVKYLSKWLKNWKNNFLNEKAGKQKDQWAKKAVLLTGKPGIGKITSAKLVSQMLGFRTIELNASDNRGKADPEIEERMKRRTAISLKELVNNQFLSFGKKHSTHPNVVLIMDEVDAMVSADNGGIVDLISSIKVSKIPIICICNDQYDQKLRGLVRFCSILGFQKPKNQMMVNRLKEIANSEGVQVTELALMDLARKVNGDVHMAINQLQYLSLKSDIKVVGSNDLKGLFNSSTDHLTTVDKLFGRRDYDHNIDEQLELSAIDAKFVALNVQENYINYRPNEDLTIEQLRKKIMFAADPISSGDVMDEQMTRYQKRQLFQSRCLTTSVIPGCSSTWIKIHIDTGGK